MTLLLIRGVMSRQFRAQISAHYKMNMPDIIHKNTHPNILQEQIYRETRTSQKVPLSSPL